MAATLCLSELAWNGETTELRSGDLMVFFQGTQTLSLVRDGALLRWRNELETFVWDVEDLETFTEFVHRVAAYYGFGIQVAEETDAEMVFAYRVVMKKR